MKLKRQERRLVQRWLSSGDFFLAPSLEIERTRDGTSLFFLLDLDVRWTLPTKPFHWSHLHTQAAIGLNCYSFNLERFRKAHRVRSLLVFYGVCFD